MQEATSSTLVSSIHFEQSVRGYRTILIIGLVEIFIGSLALISNLTALTFDTNPKDPAVLFFVTLTGTLSAFLGVGLIQFKKFAYQLLLYFSSVIILSKILIFLNIIELNGALDTSIPQSFKDLVSIAYHSFIIYFLTHSEVKKIFKK